MLIGVLMSLSVAAQTKYFVKPAGFGKGTSWSLASNDLQGIINNALPGDTVFVAIGTYKGSFFMKEGVTVLGGYRGKVNSNFDRIYPGEAANDDELSILDGDNQQRVLTQLCGFERPTYWEGFILQNGKPSVNIETGSFIYAKESSRVAGVVYRYNPDTRQGMVIGLDEVKKQWGGYRSSIPNLEKTVTNADAINDKSGKENTEKIVAFLGDANMDFSSETYEKNGNYAAQWCNKLEAYGYDDWYLPSCGEWEEIYQAKSKINNILSSMGKSLKNGYWTSTQVGDLMGWTYYFENGYKHNALKYTMQNVRPVRAFQLSEELNDIYFAGGGALLTSNGILMNCVIRNNESSSLGGGIFAGSGSKVMGCLVYGNTAAKTGNGIFAETSNVAGNIPATLILNSTITYNAEIGVEISSQMINDIPVDVIWPELQNSIVYGYAERLQVLGMFMIENCCYQADIPLNEGNNLINEDVKFIDAGNRNFLLQDDSPCLKAGNVDFVTANKIFKRDLKGYTRALCMFDGSRYVDMGAFQQGETDYFLKLFDKKAVTAIGIAPNPVQAGTKLQLNGLPESEDYILLLYDLMGNLMLKQESVCENSLIAPDKSGIYLLHVMNKNGETKSFKLIVK